MFCIDVIFKVKDRPVSGEQFADALVKELAQSLKNELQPANMLRAQDMESLLKAVLDGARESRHKTRLLSRREAATILGLKESTMQKYIGLRKIHVVRIGRRVMISPETIEKIVNEGVPGSLRLSGKPA